MLTAENSVTLLSPSKVRDFTSYFIGYPRRQLHTDLFLDLILYPKLSLHQTGFGTVFLLRNIERGQWKNSFEDLINFGAVQVNNSYINRAQRKALLRHHNLTRDEEGADLAFFHLFSYRQHSSLICRAEELDLFDRRSTAWLDAMNAPYQAGPLPQDNAHFETVAKWLLKVQIPTAFRPPPDLNRDTVPGQMQPDEMVWIAPDELATILRTLQAEGIEQFRNFVGDLAAKGPSDVEVYQALAEKRRLVKRAENRADLTSQAIGLVVEVSLEHLLSLGALALGKGAEWITKTVAAQVLTQPYRWLLMTEEIETQLANRPRGATNLLGEPATSISMDAFVADRRETWKQFTLLIKATITTIIALLVLMAIFLL